jgi:hypothetical protein
MNSKHQQMEIAYRIGVRAGLPRYAFSARLSLTGSNPSPGTDSTQVLIFHGPQQLTYSKTGLPCFATLTRRIIPNTRFD